MPAVVVAQLEAGHVVAQVSFEVDTLADVVTSLEILAALTGDSDDPAA